MFTKGAIKPNSLRRPSSPGHRQIADVSRNTLNAAFSTRLINRNYFDFCCKLRRSGDNAEKDFGFDVKGGFDRKGAEGWINIGGGTKKGLVTIWYDQSGNTNNATQTTAANQPELIFNVLNGHAILRFDGTNDYFDLPSGVFTIPAAANTGFYVAKQDAAATERILTMADGGSTRHVIQYVVTPTVSFFSNVDQTAITQAVTPTDFNIIRTRRSGATQAVTVNGAAETTDANGLDVPGIDGARIGTTLGVPAELLDGDIAEIILHSASLSTADILAIESDQRFFFLIEIAGGPAGDAYLLQDGDFLLLQDGDNLLLN